MAAIKTEHVGQKNGGGHWGTRREAKERCRVLRRANDEDVTDEQLRDFWSMRVDPPGIVLDSQTGVV